jgi:predicted component of type VI protein secretion system
MMWWRGWCQECGLLCNGYGHILDLCWHLGGTVWQPVTNNRAERLENFP